MASELRLPTVSEDLLRRALPILATTFLDPDDGLEGLVLTTGIRTLLPRLQIHTLYCYILLQREAASVRRALQRRGWEPSPEIPNWVYESALAENLVMALELLAPWFSEEVTQVMETLLSHKETLLQRLTAPEQMLWQWYTGRFAAALERLEALGLSSTEDEQRGVATFVAESQRLAAAAAATPVRWVKPQQPQTL